MRKILAVAPVVAVAIAAVAVAYTYYRSGTMGVEHVRHVVASCLTYYRSGICQP